MLTLVLLPELYSFWACFRKVREKTVVRWGRGNPPKHGSMWNPDYLASQLCRIVHTMLLLHKQRKKMFEVTHASHFKISRWTISTWTVHIVTHPNNKHSKYMYMLASIQALKSVGSKTNMYNNYALVWLLTI